MAQYSLYESFESLIQEAPAMAPTQMYNPPKQEQQPMGGQVPHQTQAPQQQYAPETKNVPVPQAPPQASIPWKDISDFNEVSDWVYLAVAALLIEIIGIGITRFFPSFSGKYLNLWYSRFKLSAVLTDIASILIGFGIARYLYTEYVYPKHDWNPVYFTGLAVGVQIVHDILFYIGVIKQVPEGSNGLIDVFKPYAEDTGAKAIAGDSAMMIMTGVSSMLLKATSPHIVFAVGLVSLYVLPYLMEKKNEFSGLS